MFESDDEDGNLENAVVEQQRLDEQDEDEESNLLGQNDNKLQNSCSVSEGSGSSLTPIYQNQSQQYKASAGKPMQHKFSNGIKKEPNNIS